MPRSAGDTLDTPEREIRMHELSTLVLIFALTAGWQRAAAASPVGVIPINEASIGTMRKQHALASAEVEDPVYKRKQRYEGIWLSDLLKDLDRGSQSDSDLYIRFRCKDGYLPIMPLTRALGAKGLVAIRDVNAPQGKDWEVLPDSNDSSTPA